MKDKAEPQSNCARCPRLHGWRRELRQSHPDWHNAPVPCFGNPKKAALLIAGLAPGLKGANRTGRVFTGDGAGTLLYQTMLAQGFAKNSYDARADDGLALVNSVITNVVRCVPPNNIPLPTEIKACQTFLKARIESMPKLKVIIALGHVAHRSIITTFSHRQSDYPFKHGATHRLGSFLLLDSYHCSRRNISTKLLTAKQFTGIFKKARRHLAL